MASAIGPELVLVEVPFVIYNDAPKRNLAELADGPTETPKLSHRWYSQCLEFRRGRCAGVSGRTETARCLLPAARCPGQLFGLELL